MLMVGGSLSGFNVTWSLRAEQEAARHMKPLAVSPRVIRERFGYVLGPSGDVADRFNATSEADRQIIADAQACRAQFIITEDVDDFAWQNLIEVGISAVNPALFLSFRLTEQAYTAIIDLFVQNQVSPPTTPEEFHSAIARQHPLLFAAHANLYKVEPKQSNHASSKVLFRGRRCVACNNLAVDRCGVCSQCSTSMLV